MVKRDISQLAIYSIEQEIEELPVESLRSLYLNRPSEIVYIVKDEKLYSVVCMEDVLCTMKGEGVKVNKDFVALTEYNVIKAHEFFQRNPQVNKLPVINNGVLVGDYSRWDDMLYIERNHSMLMQEKDVKRLLETYDMVYVVEPVESNTPEYLDLLQYLQDFHVIYTILDKEQIGEILQQKVICIFLNEDERRGVQCLYGLVPREYDSQEDNTYRYDMLADTRWKARLATYKSLLHQIEENLQLEKLGINKPSTLAFDMINDKATILLSELNKRGVKCFCLHYGNDSRLGYTEYWDNFINEIEENLVNNPISIRTPWLRKKNEEFCDDLYQNEDYRNGVAQKEIFESHLHFDYEKNISGKYFNAKDGRRITCFQPQRYIGTIYLLGVCFFVGRYVEDQYTVGSYLQKMLLKKGYLYRVENYAAMLRRDGTIDSRLEEIDGFYENDIVICQSTIGEIVGPPGFNLREVFEEHRIPSKWVMDEYAHCNHKAVEIVAESLVEMIKPCLLNEQVQGSHNRIEINFHAVMGDYVKHKYLDRYFFDFYGWRYSTVGAIVMACDLFDSGHRYLIEQARQQVDYLIVFVVQEDEFFFPFEERYKMVLEGTRDLNNVMVVPNGDFIFSKKNFPEYYEAREMEAAIVNAEYDINIFADYIAKPLHITHRFAGKELKKKVMKIYNEAMGRVLPQKGITYVEIPKLEIEGENVNTVKIRNYLKNAEYTKAFVSLPDTTRKYLMQQLCLETSNII